MEQANFTKSAASSRCRGSFYPKQSKGKREVDALEEFRGASRRCKSNVTVMEPTLGFAPSRTDLISQTSRVTGGPSSFRDRVRQLMRSNRGVRVGRLSTTVAHRERRNRSPLTCLLSFEGHTSNYKSNHKRNQAFY